MKPTEEDRDWDADAAETLEAARMLPPGPEKISPQAGGAAKHRRQGGDHFSETRPATEIRLCQPAHTRHMGVRQSVPLIERPQTCKFEQGRRDLELDHAETGIADHDGLLEQVGWRDWRGPHHKPCAI